MTVKMNKSVTLCKQLIIIIIHHLKLSLVNRKNKSNNIDKITKIEVKSRMNASLPLRSNKSETMYRLSFETLIRQLISFIDIQLTFT